jgi:hypothetical protein
MSNRTERQTEQGAAAHTTEPEPVLSSVGLLEAVTTQVAELQIDEQRIFIAKIAALLSPSVLGAAPGKTKASHQPTTLKRRLFGSVRGSRQSSRLRKSRNNYSSSHRSQAAICKQLGIIDNIEDFDDDTLLEYIQLFKKPIQPTSIAKLASMAGLSYPSQLHLPDDELQGLLEELAARGS